MTWQIDELFYYERRTVDQRLIWLNYFSILTDVLNLMYMQHVLLNGTQWQNAMTYDISI